MVIPVELPGRRAHLVLDRQFTAAAPNQRWVGDTTEFVIGSSGKLYLAVTLLSQVCRLAPKDFRQRRPGGRGGWSETVGASEPQAR